jgi:hypothetical protein
MFINRIPQFRLPAGRQAWGKNFDAKFSLQNFHLTPFLKRFIIAKDLKVLNLGD